MGKIKSVIYCLNTKNENNDGNVNANGILNCISPEYVPGSFSFSIIITILGIEEKEYNLNVEFQNEKGEVLAALKDVKLPSQKNETNLPNEYFGLNISVDWQNIVFKKSGIYRTVVRLDDEKKEFPIFVKGKNE